MVLKACETLLVSDSEAGRITFAARVTKKVDRGWEDASEHGWRASMAGGQSKDQNTSKALVRRACGCGGMWSPSPSFLLV